MYYYEVAPIKIVRATAMSFTYHSVDQLAPGQLVQVLVAHQFLIGVVIKTTKKPCYKTKVIHTTLPIPPLPLPMLKTSLWISDYYTTHLATVLQTILPTGLTKKRRTYTRPHTSLPKRKTNDFRLNLDQQRAVKGILLATPGTVLLHGITGSGKTAVYKELTRHAFAQGKSVIVLVPEIALTPQLVAEFSQQFKVLITHSRQTEAERHRVWLEILTSSTPRVVIGPRSTLFLPLAKLGYIIIDEAHEPSYKQDKAPRYSALRVASVLAQQHGAVVVQGSATPLVSEYYLAQSANRPVFHLPHKARPNTTDPTIQLVDLTKRQYFVQHRFLSNQLLAAMDATLAKGYQVLLFHNRRGSANVSFCTQCGWSANCPRCFVPLTLHADCHQLQCHLCGYHIHVLTACPDCGSTNIVHRGIGTKLIETEIKSRYPTKRVVRFDSDTTAENTLERRYQDLYDGQADIIIGTQTIAKGLDLPNLRTVGIIQADVGLALPDYTANERVFELLAQVVGRVGRSNQATAVVVQAFRPNHPIITAGLAQDYTSFYNQTLQERQRSQFPPFVHLLKLTCTYKTESAAIRNAQALAQTIRRANLNVTVLGPTPAFYERQHDTYRWQLVIKASRRHDLMTVISTVPTHHWQIDIDPQSLL